MGAPTRGGLERFRINAGTEILGVNLRDAFEETGNLAGSKRRKGKSPSRSGVGRGRETGANPPYATLHGLRERRKASRKGGGEVSRDSRG